MPSMTRGTLTTLVGELIGDPSNTRWSATQVQDRIQQAQEYFVLDTRCLVDTQTETVVDGQSEYDLPTDCLDITRVTHKGTKLGRISKFELDSYMSGDWSADGGTPALYYVDLDPNNKKLVLYPTPGSGDAGANLVEEWVKIPPTLTTDSSVPLDGHTLLAPYHSALAYKAASYLLHVLPDEKSVKMAADYEAQYKDLVSQCIETFKQMGQTTPMRMRGGRYFRGL